MAVSRWSLEGRGVCEKQRRCRCTVRRRHSSHGASSNGTHQGREARGERQPPPGRMAVPAERGAAEARAFVTSAPPRHSSCSVTAPCPGAKSPSSGRGVQPCGQHRGQDPERLHPPPSGPRPSQPAPSPAPRHPIPVPGASPFPKRTKAPDSLSPVPSDTMLWRGACAVPRVGFSRLSLLTDVPQSGRAATQSLACRRTRGVSVQRS